LIFHIQLVFGALLYILSPYSKWNENTMSDDITRLYAVEHPLMMFAAVMFITIVNSRLKKSSEVKISNMVLVAAAIACILAMIPWHAWPGSNSGLILFSPDFVGLLLSFPIIFSFRIFRIPFN